jgi:glycosyltransferase involved in cell wall biosynthesis
VPTVDLLSSKKTLLFVTNVDWYYDLHWKERISSNLTNNFEVTVSFAETKSRANTKSFAFLPFRLQRSSLNPFSNISSFIHAASILRNHHFDMIHSATIKPNIYFGLWARFFSLPIILTVPGLGTVFSLNGMRYSLVKKLILFLYRTIGKNNNCYFVFENNTDRLLLKEQGVCTEGNSSVVAGAGVDMDYFQYHPEQESTCPLRILFASRLLHSKGIDELIKAVRRLKKEGHKIRLDIAGIIDTDSKDAISLQQIEQWHNTGDINWLGQIDDMPQLLAKVHIVALPARYREGLPRILLEASSCGRPVITTDVPGCRDFVQHKADGLLVEPGSVDQLCLAIEFLLNKNNRERLGKAGYRKVAKSFTTERVVQQYDRIYKKLSQENSRKTK